ncbi:hypothetical protein [Rummeliibacillus pycnus]|uniref:hypothetical protein n=1 Tax=Rummeliibacillus pycnus TaxID=101070 RepID=UPI003D2E97AD
MYSTAEKKNNSLIFHSSTMNAKIFEKYKSTEGKRTFYFKAENLFSPYQEFSIKVDDEKLWNLIEVNNTYFINVSWKSPNSENVINYQTTNLLQIEKLDP